MVRSSFFSLGLSRTPGPRSPGLGFGGETGPLAASRESLSLSLSLPPGVLPVPWGALRGPFADGGVSFAWGPWLPRRRVSRGPLLPPYGWASLGETIPCGLCQIRVPPTRWTSVCLGQVLGRVRFSGRPLGGCLQQVVLGGRLGACRFGRLAGGDPRAVQSGPYRAIVPC